MQGSYLQDWLLHDTDYSWRLEPEVAGNSCAIADIGSHWMDAVQHVTGHRITEVMADLKTVIPVRKKPKKQTETFTSNVPTEFDEVEFHGSCSIDEIDDVRDGSVQQSRRGEGPALQGR